nr:retrovirus-related Pol polyprotein from transposon TNT 1-94 [Tanacetum cinerariifolium]
MATNDKQSSTAGTDNRPPMLEESDFESWKVRIERYIRGKPFGKLIWKSIKNGPTPYPTITVTTEKGEQQTQVTREKTDEEFIEAENNKERADIQATNILSQGFPRHIFNTLNQTKKGKKVWENVELLMQGSSLTEQQKKETLFDQYESSSEEYQVCQQSTFVLGQTLNKMNHTSGNAGPLAYMDQATQSTSSLSQYVPPPPQYAPAPQQASQSTNDAMLAMMNHIVNLLSRFQKQFPPTNNQLRTSTNPTTQATIQYGQITTESVQRRALVNTGKHVATGSQGNKKGNQEYGSVWFKDKALLMEAKEKGAVLDAEAEAFLADVEYTVSYAEPFAITTTTTFEVSHEDAYDFDVNEGPHAVATFMANLKQTGPSTGEGSIKRGHTAVRIKNNSLRDKNVSIKKHYQDLYKSKAESNSNVSSREAVPEKPKVLAPGLYAMTPKYVPPQKRNKREVNTPLPRNEKVSLVKKPNVPVYMSTGIKSVIEANKSKSKCETKTHRNLPARSENSVSVCKTCNDYLVFGNHDKCGVSYLNSLNDKNLKVKNNVNVKQVWKATGKLFASVGSKWRPTGRKFSLGDKCPLTRITKPEVVPLEKSRSVSTNELANNVTVIPGFSKKPLASYIRRDRKIKDTSAGSPPNAETQTVNDHVNINNLSANQLDPNKNWVSDVSNSTTSSFFKCMPHIVLWNDQFAAIVGYGDYKIGDTIITRVSYVEGLSHNLFSVGQFCDA